MKKLFLLSLLLVGCETAKPSYEPQNNDEYLEQLETFSDQKIKADTLQVYTYVGAALFAAGVLLVALTPKFKSGVIIALGGLLAMGTPFVFNSEWFSWVFGIAVVFALLNVLYVLFRTTMNYIESKRNNSNNE